MAGSERWYFTKEQLSSTPSRKCGLDYDKELSYRQQAANFIQDMGQRLHVSQLCINTAIVYMHRFYMFHSFTRFHRNAIAACALFLAAKVEEQPRKLEHVIKVSHVCLHRDSPQLDPKSDVFLEKAHELVTNENIMLQTLGFDIAIDHPHTYVVKCCQLVRASKDLAQTSYFMATNSLHLTTMCLQYRPTVVACVCIHLACKWTRWEIPRSTEDKDWFWYIDKTVTLELLEELTSEFLAIVDKCPSRLKRKIMSGSNSKQENPQGGDKRPMGDTPSTSGTSPPDMNQFDVDGRRDFLDMTHEHLHQQKLALPNLHSNSSQDSTSSLCSLQNSISHSVMPVSAAPQVQQQQPQATMTTITTTQITITTVVTTTTTQQLTTTTTATTDCLSSLHQSPVKIKKSEAGHSISLAAYKEMKERKEKEMHAELKRTSTPDVKHARGDHDKREPFPPMAHAASSKAHPEERQRLHHGQPVGHEKERSRHHHKGSRNQAGGDVAASKAQGNENLIVHKDERHLKNLTVSLTPLSEVANIVDHGKHQLAMTVSADKHENNSNALSLDTHSQIEAVPLDDDAADQLSAIPAAHIGSHQGVSSSPMPELKCGLAANELPLEGNGAQHYSSVNLVQNSQSDSQSLQDDLVVNERLQTNGALETDTKMHRYTAQESSSSSKSGKSKSSKSKSSTASPKEKHSHSSEEKKDRKRKSPITDSLPPKSQNVPAAAYKALPETKDRSEKQVVENHVSSRHEKHKRSKHSQEKAEKASSSSRGGSDVPPTPSPGGLKITIPKDKIILNTKQDTKLKPATSRGTGSPPREALKLKIPRVKITNSETPKVSVTATENSTPPPVGLKLRITKDRLSYSSSQKSDQESRKRERSPSDHRTKSPSGKSPKIARTEAHVSSKKVSHSSSGSHSEQQDVSVHDSSHLGETVRSSKHKHSGDHVGNGGHHSSAPSKHPMDNAGMYPPHAKGAAPQMPPPAPYMMSYGAPPTHMHPFQQYIPYHPMHMGVGRYPPQHYQQVYPPMPPPPSLPIPEGPPLPKEPPPVPPPPPPPE